MSRCRPIRARVLAALVAILLSATLALASGGQPPVQATVRAVADVQVMSTPGSEAFRSGLQQSGTNDRDVLEKALLTVGVAAAAAVLALFGYLIRKRVGFWLHRPQVEDRPAGEERH